MYMHTHMYIDKNYGYIEVTKIQFCIKRTGLFFSCQKIFCCKQYFSCICSSDINQK